MIQINDYSLEYKYHFSQTIWLSTAPTEALTHWYQVRCLIATPLFGRQGEIVTGQVHMIANKRQSYDVEIRLECDGKLSANTLDLKNPYFRYTGQAIAAPPGSNTQSPAEQYWLNAAIQAVPQVGGKDYSVYSAYPAFYTFTFLHFNY